MKKRMSTALLLCIASLMACAPTVQVQAPDKPLEINLNVKIDHQIPIMHRSGK